MKVFTLVLTLLLVGCASAGKTPTRSGLCAHPGVAGGMPFEFGAETTFDKDDHLIIQTETLTLELIGANCILIRE